VRKIRGRSDTNNKISALRQLLTRRHIIMICLVAVGTFFVTVGALMLLAPELEAGAARDEYRMLREEFAGIPGPTEDLAEPELLSDGADGELPQDIDEEDEPDDVINLSILSLDELAALNSDFIGWMSIRNVLEYPVVRGSDNRRYLNTTFMGHRNSAGAIFMDYRHLSGFDGIAPIIYGHHSWDGSMFAPIVQYLDPGFMERNPNIVITTRDGRTLTYRVFAARHTNQWDYAYTIALLYPQWAATMFPDVPHGKSHFMVLSTCTRGGYDDERILVFAAR